MEIAVNLFVEMPINKMMQMVDLGDGGRKIFGIWAEGKLTAQKEEVTDYDIKKLIKAYLDKDRVYYCQIQNMYGFKSEDVHAFSDGYHFTFISDMKKALKNKNMLEIYYEA